MSEPFSLVSDVALLRQPVVFETARIVAGFSLRRGGTSTGPFSSLNMGLHVKDESGCVVKNRRILSGQIGFPLNSWVCAEQVHGTNIARATAEMAGAGADSMETVVRNVDGLFTTETDLLLSLCFADCVPIYFYCLKPVAVGIFHAGWRGSVGLGAGKMVDRLSRELQIEPEAISAVIGPAIGAQDYEVDQKVFDKVRCLDPAIWSAAVHPHGSGHYLLDLQELNRAVLIHSGIPEKQVFVTKYTTYAFPDLFYSFRRDHGVTGRMMGFIGIKDEGES